MASNDAGAKGKEKVKKAPAEGYKGPPKPPPVETLYGSKNTTAKEGKFYVTTAINYTNGPPHIGHAYEAVLTDVVARYHRAYGRDVFFLTGTDEHGQKIAASAAAAGLTPKQSCDKWVEMFQDLNARFSVSNDDYIRTTDAYHEETCKKLWEKCVAAGDIYLGDYKGWYNVKEETFVTDTDAKKADYKDPQSGEPLKQISEKCYFFRLSKYHDRLLAHIEANPEFITPDNRRQEIKSFLENGPLEDLCISRTTFDWGVPVPKDPKDDWGDDKHVMYVWFDALTNYVSATKLLLEGGEEERRRLWPADAHVVGKDITRFHCVIWPAMLWSAGLELPKRICGHGFVQDADGKKMSKSVGNVIDPHTILDRYPADSIRYYLCNEATYGADLKCSERSLLDVHNQNLLQTVGNLAQRAAALTHKYYDGVVPEKPAGVTLPLPFDLLALKAAVDGYFMEFQVKQAVQEVYKACSETNLWLTNVEPWKMKEDRLEDRKLAIRLLVEAIYALAHFLSPFLPLTCTCIFNKFTPGTSICELKPDFSNLEAGHKITSDDWMEGHPVLFLEIKPEAEDKTAAAKPAPKPAPKPGKDKAAKQSKDDGKKGGAAGKSKPEEKEKMPEFDAEGLRHCVKADFIGRYYLAELNDQKHPAVSGVATFTAEGSFDQTIYAADAPKENGVMHTANGAVAILTSRTGGIKFKQKESQLVLKSHHCSNPDELKAETILAHDARVSKAGTLVLDCNGFKTVWTRKRLI